MPPESAPVLSYGKRPPRLGRKILLFTLLAILAAAAIYVTPLARQHFNDWLNRRRYIAAQTASLAFAAPPDQVAFSDDPASPTLVREQSVWSDLVRNSSSYSTLSNVDPDHAALFLHKLTSPAGHQRLVYIGILPPESVNATVQTMLTRQVLSLATSAAPPKNLSASRGMYLFSLIRNQPSEPLTLYAGQPDPADPSHFTIPFQFRGARRTIDGYLQDDDTVALDPHLGYERTPASGTDGGFALDRYASQKIPFGKPLFTLNGPLGHVEIASLPSFPACAFSPDDKFLAVSSTFGPQIALLDMATHKTIREFHPKYASVPPTGMAFTPDGKTLITLANRFAHDFISYDVQSGEEINRVRGADGEIETFDFSRDSTTVLAKTSQDIIYTYTLPGLTLLKTDLSRNPFTGEITSGGRRIKYFQGGPWYPAPGTVFPNDLSYRTPGLTAISPDEKSFVVTDTYSITLFDRANKFILAREVYDPIKSGIISYRAAGFSPDGKLLAVIVDNHGLCLWQLPDADTVYDWPTPNALLGFTFSPHSRYLATIDTSDTLSIWDLSALPR